MQSITSVKSKTNHLITILVISFLCILFFVNSVVAIYKYSVVFPILNGLVLFSLLFLFKGKYRVFSLFFFAPSSKFMTVKNTSFGSFFTWIVFIYLFICIIQLFIDNKHNKLEHYFKNLVLFIFLAAYTLFINLLNYGMSLSFSNFSHLIYLTLFISIFIDSRADKNIKLISISFLLGTFIANLIPFYFIYISKHTYEFLELYIPSYVRIYNAVSKDVFRFTGLKGDANYDSLYILLSSVLSVLSVRFFETKKTLKIFVYILAVLIQFFAILSGSKTYIIVSILVIVFFLSSILFEKKRLFVGISIMSLAAIFVIVFGINNQLLSKTLLRMLYLDTRAGFLSGITTSRFNIFVEYISSSFSKPLSFIFGYGIKNISYGFDYHNTYLQLFRDYGLFGSVLFVTYVASFSKGINKNFKRKYFIIPMFLVLFFGVALHVVYDEIVYLSLILYYLLILCFNSKFRSEYNVLGKGALQYEIYI